MKNILICLSTLLIACTNQGTRDKEADHDMHQHRDTAGAVKKNHDARWKADEATKRNVAAMVQVLNDPENKGEKNKLQLTGQLQSKIDTLVQQCKMTGPDHDALHVWLENVLKSLKELKQEEGEYNEAYARLKKDVDSFYVSFE